MSAILVSPAVRKTKLFDKAYESHSISVVWPEREDAMLASNRSIKSDGPNSEARQVLLSASDELTLAGTDLQIIACSEFFLINDSIRTDVEVVDTLHLLVGAIVDFSLATYMPIIKAPIFPVQLDQMLQY